MSSIEKFNVNGKHLEISNTFIDIVDTDSSCIDFEIKDSSDNALVRFIDGHIKTKNFNSETVLETINELKISSSTNTSYNTTDIRIVSKTATKGQYSTLKSALSGATSNTVIYIYEGVYEEKNLYLPRGITIKGFGNVVIKGYFDKTTLPSVSYAESTLECYYGATLDNLTITCQNGRYPIHADFSSGCAKWNITNCTFIHYGNNEIYNYWLETNDSKNPVTGLMTACSAWGGGTRGGDEVYCYNCIFESVGRAFSTHNNSTTEYSTLGKSKVHLENCIMISHGVNIDGSLINPPCSLFVQSLDCSVNCDVILNDCKLNGYVVRQNSGAGWTNRLKMFNCTPCKLIFGTYGSENVSLPNRDQISTYQSDNNIYDETDYINSFITDSSITKGNAVKKSKNGRVQSISNSSDDIYGIAMESAAEKELLHICTGGYLNRIYINGVSTTSLTEGNYIYMNSDGSFSKTVSETASKLEVVDNQNVLIK